MYTEPHHFRKTKRIETIYVKVALFPVYSTSRLPSFIFILQREDRQHGETKENYDFWENSSQ
jgi:hypothetical protein